MLFPFTRLLHFRAHPSRCSQCGSWDAFHHQPHLLCSSSLYLCSQERDHWWFSPEHPLINGWQIREYKCSHPFLGWDNYEMWPIPCPDHLCFMSHPWLGPLVFPAPLPNFSNDFSWEHSLMHRFLMGFPCLRICFQGIQMETTNSVIIIRPSFLDYVLCRDRHQRIAVKTLDPLLPHCLILDMLWASRM